MADKMTARKWLIANRDLYSDRRQWIKDSAKTLSQSEKSVATKANQHQLWNKERVRMTKSDECGKDIIPAEDFLNDIDIVKKVLDFLNETVADSYIEDDKLRRKLDISQSRWRQMTQLPPFENRSITYDCGGGRKKTVWSSEEGIEAARQRISMARYDI